MPDEQKQDHYCFRLGDLSVDPGEEVKRNAPSQEWLIAVRLLQITGIGHE